ncbi:DUF642 domain-containing protein [Thiosocius teredinicola]|uniref:DUF642 domain-containing protein n=1 Tax=Thiosocius teredinicola TaxID=1973002 RepID=UPI000F790E06
MKSIPLICTPILLMTLAVSARANLITNGSFDQDGAFVPDINQTHSMAVGSTLMPGWTVVQDSIAWIVSTNPWNLTASDGDYFLDLTDYQNGAPFGGVMQSVSTITGAAYRLDFDLGSSSQWGLPAALTASVDGNSQVYQSTSAGVDQWQSYSLSFVAQDALTDIAFIGSAGFNYIGLDNVQLTEVSPSGVPVPGGLLLMAAGMVVFRAKRMFEAA